MKRYCTDTEVAVLSGDTEGAHPYIDPPGPVVPTQATLRTQVRKMMEVMTTHQCAAEIQLGNGSWLSSDQIRALAARFGAS